MSPFLSPLLPIELLGTVFIMEVDVFKFVVVAGGDVITIPLSANPVMPGCVVFCAAAPILFCCTACNVDAVQSITLPQ